MPFAATWMDLEMIILSEVSQTEKDKHHITLLICGRERRILTNRPPGSTRYCLDVETKNKIKMNLWFPRRKDGGRGSDWEFRINMHTLLYLK